MQVFIFLFIAVLFFVLTPGVFITLPPKGSKIAVNITHAIIFALIWTVVHKLAWEWATSNNWVDTDNVKESVVSGFGHVQFLNIENT